MDNLIGKKLDGRYLIESLIGVGGMANVYKRPRCPHRQPDRRQGAERRVS